jgi:hypothetical protein
MANKLAGMDRSFRRIGPTLLAICMIGLPGVCRAANNCAWINEATASGLLGGEAIGAVTGAAAGQPTVCTFTQQAMGVTRTLRVAVERVTVETGTDAHSRMSMVAQVCGADAAQLRAIGNEALVCTADESKKRMGERVVGRVRDQVFTIAISTTLKDDPILTREALRSKIYTAAEQVAGNLF